MEIINIIRFEPYKVDFEKAPDINTSIEKINKLISEHNYEIVPVEGDLVKLDNLTLNVVKVRRTFDFLAHEKGLSQTVMIIHDIEIG